MVWRRLLGDDDEDLVGTWDPSGLDEEARVPTGRDDVTREFERAMVSLDATDEQLEALHTLRDRPHRAVASGWGSAPGQVADELNIEFPELPEFETPWWLGPLAFLAVFAILAGQIGKLFTVEGRVN